MGFALTILHAERGLFIHLRVRTKATDVCIQIISNEGRLDSVYGEVVVGQNAILCSEERLRVLLPLTILGRTKLTPTNPEGPTPIFT